MDSHATQTRMLMPLAPNECSQAGAVLGRAFRDDALWTVVLSDADQRPELLADMFAAVATTTLAAGGVAETTPSTQAVALWLPPGRDLGLWATVKARFALPRFVMKLPTRDRKRMLAVLRQLEGRKKALMTQAHWYLSAIGVDPEHQGQGLGTSLVRAGIERANNDDTAMYLETETAANVAFYQHLGFEVLEEIVAVGLDLPVWLMRRPRPSARP